NAKVGDERPRYCEVEWSAVVLGVRDGSTAPAPGKIRRHHSHPKGREALSEKIEVTAVAREAVHADHRSFGFVGSPCRVAHLRKAVRPQGDELPESGTQRRLGSHIPRILVDARGVGVESCALEALGAELT